MRGCFVDVELVLSTSEQRNWWTLVTHPHPAGWGFTEAWNDVRRGGLPLRQSATFFRPTRAEAEAAAEGLARARRDAGWVEPEPLPVEPWTPASWLAVARRRGLNWVVRHRGANVVAGLVWCGAHAQDPLLSRVRFAEISGGPAVRGVVKAGLDRKLERASFSSHELDLRGARFQGDALDALWLSGFGRVLTDDASMLHAPRLRWALVQTHLGASTVLDAPHLQTLHVDLCGGPDDRDLSRLLVPTVSRLAVWWPIVAPTDEQRQWVCDQVRGYGGTLQELAVASEHAEAPEIVSLLRDCPSITLTTFTRRRQRPEPVTPVEPFDLWDAGGPPVPVLAPRWIPDRPGVEELWADLLDDAVRLVEQGALEHAVGLAADVAGHLRRLNALGYASCAYRVLLTAHRAQGDFGAMTALRPDVEAVAGHHRSADSHNLRLLVEASQQRDEPPAIP